MRAPNGGNRQPWRFAGSRFASNIRGGTVRVTFIQVLEYVSENFILDTLLSGIPMRKPEANVVPGEAATVARSIVFESRDLGGIDPSEVIDRMLAAGHGSEFPSEVRRKRLKTWTLQVFRRLKKQGWLEAPGREGWPSTAALRACRDPRSLAKRAPRRTGHETPTRKAQPRTPPPSLEETWENIIQNWVFRHRLSDFGVAEISVAVVQHGFGTGDIGDRLDGARELVEEELSALELDGLLEYDAQSELWVPTELLRTWPAANGAMED